MNAAFYLTPKSSVVYLYDDFTIRQGLEKLRNTHFSAVPVIDREGRYIGIVSEGSFLWPLFDLIKENNPQILKETETKTIGGVIDKDKYKPVSVNVSEEELFQMAALQNFVPIIDDRDIFIGLVTRRAIITKMKQTKKRTQR
ncbi:MAG: CBS domain-containing protein [Eubacteriales bacterium]